MIALAIKEPFSKQWVRNKMRHHFFEPFLDTTFINRCRKFRRTVASHFVMRRPNRQNQRLASITPSNHSTRWIEEPRQLVVEILNRSTLSRQTERLPKEIRSTENRVEAK